MDVLRKYGEAEKKGDKTHNWLSISTYYIRENFYTRCNSLFVPLVSN